MKNTGKEKTASERLQDGIDEVLTLIKKRDAKRFARYKKEDSKNGGIWDQWGGKGFYNPGPCGHGSEYVKKTKIGNCLYEHQCRLCYHTWEIDSGD